MIGKRYQLTFTETTHLIVDRLMRHGFNIRDLLNAGVVLFDKATLEERGTAIATATTIQQQQLDESLREFKKVVFSTKIELLSDEDADIVRQIRQLYGPEAEQSAAAAIEDESAAAAASDAAGRPGKHNHRTG